MDQVLYDFYDVYHFQFDLLWIKKTLAVSLYLVLIMLCRIRPAGEPPSPRAAHAAAAVGTMVVFQVIPLTPLQVCMLLMISLL